MMKKSDILISLTTVIATLIPLSAQADQTNSLMYRMQRHAQQVCMERGAQPGTIGFNRCMQAQMQPQMQHRHPNHRVSMCFRPMVQRRIQSECYHMAVNGDMQHCTSVLTARCEWRAPHRRTELMPPMSPMNHGPAMLSNGRIQPMQQNYQP